MTTCQHCSRRIINEDGTWIDPEATGDDVVWRETCDAHFTFTAEHEPMPVSTYADGFGIWHAEVAIGGNAVGNEVAAQAAALDAICDSLALREGPNFAPGTVDVRLRSRSSRDGVLTYHFVEVAT